MARMKTVCLFCRKHCHVSEEYALGIRKARSVGTQCQWSESGTWSSPTRASGERPIKNPLKT